MVIADGFFPNSINDPGTTAPLRPGTPRVTQRFMVGQTMGKTERRAPIPVNLLRTTPVVDKTLQGPSF